MLALLATRTASFSMLLKLLVSTFSLRVIERCIMNRTWEIQKAEPEAEGH